MSSTFHRSPDSQLGGGGLRTFVFDSVKRGLGRIRLRWGRSWDGPATA